MQKNYKTLADLPDKVSFVVTAEQARILEDLLTDIFPDTPARVRFLLGSCRTGPAECGATAYCWVDSRTGLILESCFLSSGEDKPRRICFSEFEDMLRQVAVYAMTDRSMRRCLNATIHALPPWWGWAERVWETRIEKKCWETRAAAMRREHRSRVVAYLLETAACAMTAATWVAFLIIADSAVTLSAATAVGATCLYLWILRRNNDGRRS